MGLASCEMKDEILGNKKDPGEMGVMNLSVVVDARSNDVLTKAGDGTQDGGNVSVPAVSATGYAVEISNGEGLYKTVTYDATNPSVELPVGDYTLYAHAQGEPKETEAYYGGRASLKVEKGKSTDAFVVCKMENTKIQLVYTTEMQSSFKNWEITVTAGSKSKILSYSGTNFVQQPDAFFWMLDEGVKEVRVSFVGTNKDDKAVRESRVITKPVTAEDPDWLGGDALRIDVKPGAYDPANPNGVLGIEISAEVRWSGVEDSVDVPVMDDGGNIDPEVPEEPVVPGDGAPTITGDCIGKELTHVKGSADLIPVDIKMDVPGKIEDVRVRISTDNSLFKSMLEDLEGNNLVVGETLIANETLGNLFQLPEKNQTEYPFTLSSGLSDMLEKFTGTHEFFLTVEDQAGKTATASFKVTIKEG